MKRRTIPNMIGYLDEVIRQLVVILLKMSGHIQAFKNKGGDKNENNRSISLRVGDDKLLGKYKTI